MNGKPAVNEALLEQLERERHFFQSLLKNLPDLIWMKNPEGVYLACNHEFELFFGTEEQEILGKTDYDFVDKELADFFRLNDQMAMDSLTPTTNEEWITYASDGRKVLLETTKTAIHDNSGKLIGVLGVGHDITQRAKQKELLKVNEQRLKDAQKIAGIGNWELDFETEQLYWSEQVFNIFQLDSKQFLPSYEAFLDVIHPEDRDLVNDTYQHSLATQTPYTVVHRLLIDGHTKWVEEKGNTEYTDSGMPLRSVGTIQDVTQRIEIETQINRLKSLVEYCADSIFVFEAESGKLIDANQSACEQLGYAKDELKQFHTWELSVTIKNKKTWDQVLPYLIKNQGEAIQDVHQRKDGSLIPVEVTARYIEEPDGNYFISTSRDISERKQAEKIIEESNRRYEAVLSSSKDGFWVVNQTTHRLEEVNDRYCELSGYSRSELIGKHISELDSEDDPEKVRQRTVQIISEGAAIFESKHARKDGSIWPVEVSVTYHNIQDGQLLAFIRDITERKQAEERIRHIAYHDLLTNLPNRQLLSDRLEQARSQADRSNTLLAICYLDLDEFKPVNDKFGHGVGDKLLIEVTSRLHKELRAVDTLARLGGDEFVLLLTGLETIYQCEEVVQRTLEQLAHSYTIEGHRIHISASIGTTVYPHDKSDTDTLIRHADQAMYKAKQSGKNSYCLFDPVADKKVHDYRQSLKEFETAIHKDQLVLYYQPRIDLGSGKLSSVEALVRWQHPEKGLLQPGQFLPNIEGNALLERALDEWVLKQALDQHIFWRAQGISLPVSVNIAPSHIKLSSFPAYLKALLADYPEDICHYLELEILETGAIDSTSQVAEIMKSCADLGIKFSLDDFGTGYSSLTYFHRLPINILKIDRDFVRSMLDNPLDQDIVEGIIRLAEAIKRPVVAEGVESLELGLMLIQLGCKYAQGYGIARPMPPEALIDWHHDYQKNSLWRSLHLYARDFEGPYDISVALFSHRNWLSQVKAYIESGLETSPPTLDGSRCRFHLWYSGIGRFRYGQHPAFAAIEESHSKVHEIAKKLVRLVENNCQQEAIAQLGQLEQAGEALLKQVSLLNQTVQQSKG